MAVRIPGAPAFAFYLSDTPGEPPHLFIDHEYFTAYTQNFTDFSKPEIIYTYSSSNHEIKLFFAPHPPRYILNCTMYEYSGTVEVVGGNAGWMGVSSSFGIINGVVGVCDYFTHIHLLLFFRYYNLSHIILFKNGLCGGYDGIWQLADFEVVEPPFTQTKISRFAESCKFTTNSSFLFLIYI